MEEVEDEMIDYFCFVLIDTDVIANGWLLRCVSLSNFRMSVFKFLQNVRYRSTFDMENDSRFSP
jgi:hypothetical protein